jgi:hypothetical protein
VDGLQLRSFLNVARAFEAGETLGYNAADSSQGLS